MKKCRVLVLILAFLPLCFCANEREEAKEALGQMEINYSEPTFFEVVQRGDTEAVSLFLQAGFQPDVKDENGKTPLMHAAERGYTGVALLLIEAHKEDVSAKDKRGMTALMYAAKSGQIELVEALIQSNGDVDSKDKLGKTALIYAIDTGHAEVVKTLIQAGAEVNVQGRSEMTALASTAKSDKSEIILILRRSGEKEEQCDR